MASTMKNGSGESSVQYPVVLWAQRRDRLFLTVQLENCKAPVCEVKEQTFHFKGKGGTDGVDHEVTLELFAEVDKEKTLSKISDRNIFVTLMKKDTDASFWPRLTKDKMKRHFIKTDFGRWKDEDDTEDEAEEKEDFNLDDMMQSMGGLNGGEFGGPPPEGEEEDSDDEDLPDLQ